MRARLFLSIKPRYAEAIFAGEKTVELRRVRPQLDPGDLVVVYVSSPVRAVVGTFAVTRIIAMSPSQLWPLVRGKAGVTRHEFDEYYDGAEIGIGIFLDSAEIGHGHVDLEEIRQVSPNFRPPQGYRYLAGLGTHVLDLLKAAFGWHDDRQANGRCQQEELFQPTT